MRCTKTKFAHSMWYLCIVGNLDIIWHQSAFIKELIDFDIFEICDYNIFFRKFTHAQK